jgi:hypothetical protein
MLPLAPAENCQLMELIDRPRARHTKSATRAARDWRTDGQMERPDPTYSSILIQQPQPFIVDELVKGRSAPQLGR